MRQQFRAVSASTANANTEAPEGHLWFDLITGDRDTFKTRLRPEGARWHSDARPWLDVHDDKSAKRVIGNIVEHKQSPEVFQVLVRFDMPDPNAAEIYRKHKDGVLQGCSVGFLPMPGKFHVEIEDDGEKTVVYDEYWILEGSSTGVPSNPTALQRSAELVIGDALSVNAHHPVVKARTATVSQVPATIFSTEIKPMKPEHRLLHRQMIGDALRSAEDHMAAHAAMPEFPEHQEFHAGEARSAMKRTAALCRMVGDSLAQSGETAPEVDPKAGAMTRSAPTGADAQLVREWDECRRTCSHYATQTFRDVGEKIAKSPSDLRVSWAGKTQIEAMHRKVLLERRTAEKNLETEQRNKLIQEMLDGPGLEPGLEAEIRGLDPTDPKRETRSGEAWSLTQVMQLHRDLLGAASVLTRTAPLTPGAQATDTNDALQQPEVKRSDASTDIDPKVRAMLEAGARSAGLNINNAINAARRLS